MKERKKRKKNRGPGTKKRKAKKKMPNKRPDGEKVGLFPPHANRGGNKKKKNRGNQGGNFFWRCGREHEHQPPFVSKKERTSLPRQQTLIPNNPTLPTPKEKKKRKKPRQRKAANPEKKEKKRRGTLGGKAHPGQTQKGKKKKPKPQHTQRKKCSPHMNTRPSPTKANSKGKVNKGHLYFPRRGEKKECPTPASKKDRPNPSTSKGKEPQKTPRNNPQKKKQKKKKEKKKGKKGGERRKMKGLVGFWRGKKGVFFPCNASPTKKKKKKKWGEAPVGWVWNNEKRKKKGRQGTGYPDAKSVEQCPRGKKGGGGKKGENSNTTCGTWGKKKIKGLQRSVPKAIREEKKKKEKGRGILPTSIKPRGEIQIGNRRVFGQGPNQPLDDEKNHQKKKEGEKKEGRTRNPKTFVGEKSLGEKKEERGVKIKSNSELAGGSEGKEKEKSLFQKGKLISL